MMKYARQVAVSGITGSEFDGLHVALPTSLMNNNTFRPFLEAYMQSNC